MVRRRSPGKVGDVMVDLDVDYEQDSTSVDELDSDDGTSANSNSSFSETEHSDNSSDISGGGRRSKCKFRSASNKAKRKSLKSGRHFKAGDRVKRAEVWLQAKLSLQYAGKGTTYEQLDMPLFVAGYIEALSSDLRHNKIERVTSKLVHLQNLMYTATHRDW